MKINIYKILKQIHTGDDGQISGKRSWGSGFFITSTIIGFIGLFKYPDRLDSLAVFIAPFVGTGLTLWGFSGLMTIANKKLDIQADNPPAPDNVVKVENVEQLTTSPTNTKINTDKVETITSENTTITQKD